MVKRFVAGLVIVTSGAFAQSWVSTATKGLALKNAITLSPLPPETPMHIAVGLKVRNPAQIPATLRAMVTPGNPLYGKTLSLQQFVDQFAPAAAQVQAVEDYLASYGFSNLKAEPNNLLVQGDATAASVQAAFNTTLIRFSQNGKTVFANVADAQVPAALSGTVLAVLGLHNLAIVIPPLPNPTNAFAGYTPVEYQIAYDAYSNPDFGGSHPITPGVPPAYLTAVGIIAEGDLTQVVNDLRLYEQAFSLPQVPVTVVNAGTPSSDTSGADEWDLDSQTSTGIAQQVSALYFYVATSLTDSDIAVAINRAVTDGYVKAFNMSFGECEALPYADGFMVFDDEVFGEAALQGITPFASSGDNGSACPVGPTNGVPGSGPPDVAYPASSPYVITSGGTDLFTDSNYNYSTEVAWNAGGGGISLLETAPFWQSYTGGGASAIVPSAAGGQRGIPDVAMCADPNTCGALIYVNGATSVVGGTSLSSPLSMGAWARIETAHNNSLGFAGPLIYQLGASANPTAVPPTLPTTGPFNDVIAGANGYYSATPGWDYTTGLGSWDITKVNNVVPSTYPH